MKYFLTILALLLLFFGSFGSVLALDNPLNVPNNKVGIHILFPSELTKAAALVNSNGGDWGYVIIPIQSGDKDLLKWQDFMDECRQLHIIPIIRLATEGDYFNTKVWRKPTEADVLDFANFLNSLDWPTKNRYVVVYNEVNRGDEWGGTPDATEYAQLLSYAVDVFKSRSSDFFMISSGMDNGAATTNDAINEYDYFTEMNKAVPGIFDKIDGIASHSYPNPAFATPPTIIARNSITSFQFEKNLIESYTSKDLPVFITETGWDQDVVGQAVAAQYLSTAFQTVWSTNDVVAVTPFLLQAGSGPFTQFSFLDSGGNPNAVYTAVVNLQKTKGQPDLAPVRAVLASKNSIQNLPVESFKNVITPSRFSANFEKQIAHVFKFLLQVQ